MKKTIACFCFVILLVLTINVAPVKAINITIIESQSFNAGHVMDTKWLAEATAMGHTATIMPQTTLDNNAFFATTGLLIISSGVTNLPANRIQTIVDFVQTGKPAYIQGEYLISYQSNVAFKTVVDATGSSFTLGVTASGTLAPMNVLGAFATTPNAVSPLGYFWYGSTGSGTNITYFLEYGGSYFGFFHCPVNTSYGPVCMVTDQDWINTGTSPALMRNIIYLLLSTCHPLPIDLLSFDAVCEPGVVNLTWKTASEVNNQFFTIERSARGEAFEIIGVVNGAGNSNSVLSYFFTDYNPLPGISYYRLKQTDVNGGFEYFNPVSVNANCSNTASGQLLVFNNPVEDDLIFQFTSANEETVDIAVYDICGRMVINKKIAAIMGMNESTIDLSSITKGIYFLSVVTKATSVKQKFIKK